MMFESQVNVAPVVNTSTTALAVLLLVEYEVVRESVRTLLLITRVFVRMSCS